MNTKHAKMWVCTAIAFGLLCALFFLTRPMSVSGQPKPKIARFTYAQAKMVGDKSDEVELRLNALGLTKETGFTLVATRATNIQQGGAK